MNTQVKKQLVSNFKNHLKTQKKFPLKSKKVEIFQMNVGKKCNLSCNHCHVEAGPSRTEMMDKKTLERCLELIQNPSITTVDLTGGAPEMNNNLKWFIPALAKLNKRIIVRSNLTILKIPKYAIYFDIFEKNKVEIVASLPCYLEKNTDMQRGNLVFKRSIEVLQELNNRGYGKTHVLNLVHNPVGAFLPPRQSKLEADYKLKLKQDFNIEFNHLFCITNMPIKRFADYLITENKLESYMEMLVQAFNINALDNIMCKTTLSVSYDGKLYDCDFNQMLDLPIRKQYATSVFDLNTENLEDRDIVIGNHCFGCTAGAGSSCQGELN